MSNDTAECGCEGHADNFGDCKYPALKAKLDQVTADRDITDDTNRQWGENLTELADKLTARNAQVVALRAALIQLAPAVAVLARVSEVSPEVRATLLSGEQLMLSALSNAPVAPSAMVERLCGALELVLLYHSSSPWDDAKSKRWGREVGQVEATTAILCGHVRCVLADAKKA